jgi:dihydrofolate reductase
MRKLFLFMNITLDGYIEAPGHDLSWAHNDYEAFSAGESQDTDAMLFGHRTYEMMKAFWPTPQAAQAVPDVARFMNDRPKYVASHQPFDPGWSNVTVFSGNVVSRVRGLKEQPGGGIIMLGSNTLACSLLEEGLIDEIQVLLNPVVLGKGTPLFQGLSRKIELSEIATRSFKSGSMLLLYKPAV